MIIEIALASLAFVAAGALAGVMCFAIQRGATCTVAAIDALVSERRLSSMIEASLWVVGGCSTPICFISCAPCPKATS